MREGETTGLFSSFFHAGCKWRNSYSLLASFMEGTHFCCSSPSVWPIWVGNLAPSANVLLFPSLWWNMQDLCEAKQHSYMYSVTCDTLEYNGPSFPQPGKAEKNVDRKTYSCIINVSFGTYFFASKSQFFRNPKAFLCFSATSWVLWDKDW